MTQGLTGAVIDVSYEWKLTSGGNTITETLVEDGVEMLTTYSDDNGELVVSITVRWERSRSSVSAACQIPSWRWRLMNQPMIFTRSTRAL